MAFLTIEPEIYTYDIDFNNHVSNISYIRWMEIGRLKLREKTGMPVHKIQSQGFVPVLTRTEISYKKPLLLGDKVLVEIGISKLRNISGTLVFSLCVAMKLLQKENRMPCLSPWKQGRRTG